MQRSTVHQKASSSCCPAKKAAQGPLHPNFRANPYPKVTDLFCRLPLPTLFYQPEAANLGDLMRLWVRSGVHKTHTDSFSRAAGAHRTPQWTRHSTHSNDPCSRQSVFRVTRSKQEQRTLSRASAYFARLAHVTIMYPPPGWRILTPSPFRG